MLHRHASQTRWSCLRTAFSKQSFAQACLQPQGWVKFSVAERSVEKRSAGAVTATIVGFIINYCIFETTGLYFHSVAITIAVSVGLYCGLYLAVCSTVILSLVADYCFIPASRAVFSSVSGFEHFIIATGIAIFVACLASSLRSAFRETIIAKQDAERASTAMERVLSLVSHDIRGPLSGLQMGIEFILETPGRAKKHRSILAMMLRSAKRIDLMIESLLHVTSMRAGKIMFLEFHNCDLGVEIDNAIDGLSFLGDGRLELTRGEPVWGAWAIGAILRALENLVANAVKYGAPDCPIIVKLERSDSQAILSVHNEGREIPFDVREKLFQPFQRAGALENFVGVGWGLGLASVKAIAVAHGGAVTVESDKNRGTTFALRLPIRAPGSTPYSDPRVETLSDAPSMAANQEPASRI
jgi:signal transduction histidine kinase